MKVGIYDIINDPLPKLLLIKEINVRKTDFERDETMVKILNDKLMFNKLDFEHCYAVSLTYGLECRGIIQLGVGDNKESGINVRGLGIGLLLTGAEQFMVFHNHPGGNKKISPGDKFATLKYQHLGETIGIKFIRHIAVAKDTFIECK